MDNNTYILGIDIGGTNVRIGMVKEDGSLEHFEMHRSSELLLDEPLKKLGKFIKLYIKQNAINKYILGIVIGFPSTIDKSRKTVLSTPNINGLNDLNVVDYLEQLLGIRVMIDRDVNLNLQYDIFTNHFEEKSTVLGFYIGTGLGNAIQINGHILIGKNGSAGELGHIPVINDHRLCGCGNSGCIENYASGKYLQEINAHYFSKTNLEDMFVKHCESERIQQYIEYLSIPIATEINIFDPDYVILGGGVLQMKNFPFSMLEQFIYKHSRKPYPANTLKYYYSRSNQENGVIGAGIHGFRYLKEDV